MGLKVERLITTANCATQGLIMTFFASTIACLIIICFQLVAHLGLNDVFTGIKKTSMVTGLCFVIVMYLMRFYSLMKSGQLLTIKIKQVRRTLEDSLIQQDAPFNLTDKSSDKLSVLRKRLEVYQYLSPISPYAVFGLSNRAFCATLATTVTYIIVLIKLRGMESSKTDSTIDTVNKTLTT